MKNYLFPILSFLLCLFIHFSSYAGSFMFCVNSENESDWKWAPPITDIEHARWGQGNPFIPVNSEGTWIAGTLDFNKYAHAVLDTNVNKELFTLEKAELFCRELIRHCQKLGEQYKHIGSSGGVVSPSSWAYISFTYYVETVEKIEYSFRKTREKKSTSCPNWKYPYFPNEGGTFYILK